jgi:hypothetical protein
MRTQMRRRGRAIDKFPCTFGTRFCARTACARLAAMTLRHIVCRGRLGSFAPRARLLQWRMHYCALIVVAAQKVVGARRTAAHVAELRRYPVKSLQGESGRGAGRGLRVVGWSPLGIVDRDTGMVLTARRVPYPTMAVRLHLRIHLRNGRRSARTGGDSGGPTCWAVTFDLRFRVE